MSHPAFEHGVARSTGASPVSSILHGRGTRAAGQPSRRELLWKLGGGLGGVALASMLDRDRLLAAETSSAARPLPHFAPKAKRVVQLFMSGAASQCDTF